MATLMKQKEWIWYYGTPKPQDNSSFEHKYMVMYDIPNDINLAIKALPNRLYCNKILVPYITKAFYNIINRGLQDQIKTWDGCYNPRMIRGSKTQWSTHSFGLAIDINAAWNGLGKIGENSPELIACFTDAGFISGSTFKTRADYMHFELSKEIVQKDYK